jgi:hypothetical protein
MRLDHPNEMFLPRFPLHADDGLGVFSPFMGEHESNNSDWGNVKGPDCFDS